MDRKEIERRIKIHENAIQESKEIIADLQSQLEAEKPKLRHGDYGLGGGSTLLPFVVIGDDVYWLRKGEKPSIASFRPEEFTGKLGNLVDDLKDMSKDLSHFDISDTTGTLAFGATIQLDNPEEILLQVCEKGNQKGVGSLYNLKQIASIHRNLGQLIATAIRKAKE